MSKKLMMNNVFSNAKEFVVGDSIFYRFDNDRVTGGNGSTNSVVSHTIPKLLGSFVPSVGGAIRVKYSIRTDTNHDTKPEKGGIVFEIRVNGVVVEKKMSTNSGGVRESIDFNIKPGDTVEFYNYAEPVGYGGNRFNGIDLCCGNVTPIQFINIV